MTTRQLGRTGIEVSPIGLGCMQMSGRGVMERVFPAMPQQTATEIVRTALDSGISWFDTAEFYGRGQSERALSSALRELAVQPGSVRIASKWNPVGRTAASIGRTIGRRLDALQGFPLDLHQIHLPASFSGIDAQIDAMAALVEAGRIGAIGVSNFSARQLERAQIRARSHGLVVASNQVQISLLHRTVENDGVLATARRLGITLIGYSPLRQGVLTGRYHDDPAALRSLRGVRRTMIGGERMLRRTAPLIKEMGAIAEAHGVRPAQVALAWVITNYGDTVVCIPGASKPSQAAEAAAAMDLRLSADELAALNQASSRAVGSIQRAA